MFDIVGFGAESRVRISSQPRGEPPVPAETREHSP